MKENIDLILAKKYISNYSSAKARGHDFNLSFSEFKSLKQRKKCFYTGITLTDESRSLDRIDNSIGYVKGNVVACHTTVNQLKSMVEDKTNLLTLDLALASFNRWDAFNRTGK